MRDPGPNQRAIAHQIAPGSRGAIDGLPPLWARLPAEICRQLAQQIARILQRFQPLSPPSEENLRADHDVIGR